MPDCPKCEEPMVLRDGANGKFYGCSDFPKCRGTRPASQDEEGGVDRLLETRRRQLGGRRRYEGFGGH